MGRCGCWKATTIIETIVDYSITDGVPLSEAECIAIQHLLAPPTTADQIMTPVVQRSLATDAWCIPQAPVCEHFPYLQIGTELNLRMTLDCGPMLRPLHYNAMCAFYLLRSSRMPPWPRRLGSHTTLVGALQCCSAAGPVARIASLKSIIQGVSCQNLVTFALCV